MRLLLDTHAFLWIVTQDKRTPNHWIPIVEDTSNDIFLSVASLWEIAIKSSIGKLKVDLTLPELVQNHIKSVD
jgi:PIN domain nuclease of toxin-antitoxin system